MIGQKPAREEIGGRTRIDVRMEGVTYLEEVVVTAYTEQRRADITGAVAASTSRARPARRAPASSRSSTPVPGITVAASGSPGSRSTVRIRGISSFQNNDPLYVIDGVPVQDSYVNWLNPADITSIQVLKDASAASIYGSRASNGVIVIETTKRGASGPAADDALGAHRSRHARRAATTTSSSPTRWTTSRSSRRSYTNAGRAKDIPTNIYGDPNNPSVPTYIFCAANTCNVDDTFGRPQRGRHQYAYPNSADHARQRRYQLVEGGVQRSGPDRGLQPERRGRG